MSIDLSYIAGFFDGEGCVSIKKNGNHFFLDIDIGQKSIEVLQLIADRFGGGVYSKETRYGTFWQWRCSSLPALLFLEAIYPYLIVKKDQVALAIEFKDRFPTFLSGADKRGRWSPYSKEEIQARDSYRLRLKEMKNG